MPYTSVRIFPVRLLLLSVFFAGFGGFIAVQGWHLRFYGLTSIGVCIVLLCLWLACVALRQAARVARSFTS